MDQIDQTTQKFTRTFGELSHEELNWKPSPDAWSIAQNIEHLVLINESYFPIIESIREGSYSTPIISKIGFLVSFFGNFLLKAVDPARKNKVKTFPVWEPRESNVPAGILDRFVEHQSELKKVIAHSQDLVEQGVVISSPANKYIVYKLETAFEVLVTHEKRHFEQSKEVLQLLQMNANDENNN